MMMIKELLLFYKIQASSSFEIAFGGDFVLNDSLIRFYFHIIVKCVFSAVLLGRISFWNRFRRINAQSRKMDEWNCWNKILLVSGSSRIKRSHNLFISLYIVLYCIETTPNPYHLYGYHNRMKWSQSNIIALNCRIWRKFYHFRVTSSIRILPEEKQSYSIV